jgi:hypothetical protein
MIVYLLDIDTKNFITNDSIVSSIPIGQPDRPNSFQLPMQSLVIIARDLLDLTQPVLNDLRAPEHVLGYSLLWKLLQAL